MAWKHTSENKESRIQKDVNEYLKRKTGEQDKIVMKQQVAKKMEHISSTRLEAMERAYKNQGRSVPLRYKVKK